MNTLTREEKLASFQQLTKLPGIKTGREFSAMSNKARIFIELLRFVKLLGTGSREEDQPGAIQTLSAVYGPMSASRRREFLERLQSSRTGARQGARCSRHAFEQSASRSSKEGRSKSWCRQQSALVRSKKAPLRL